MSVILTATLLLGSLANWGFYALGLHDLGVRHAVSIAVAYLGFYFLVRTYVRSLVGLRSRDSGSSFEANDAIDPADFASDPAAAVRFAGNGGQFGGGGASASWAQGGKAGAPAFVPPPSASAASPEVSSWDVDFDGEAWLVVAAGALIGAIFGSAIYLVVQSPHILSEGVLELLFASGVYTRAKIVGSSTSSGLLKRTFVPFLIVTILALALGHAVRKFAPDATTLRDVWVAISA